MVIHRFDLEKYCHEKDLNKPNIIQFILLLLSKEMDKQFVKVSINTLRRLELQTMSNFVDNLLSRK